MQSRLAFGAENGLRVCVLGSGSGGNAVVLEAGGRRLLVDAGFSCREIERRLLAVGCPLEGFEGLVVTHEHGDHIRGVEVFARRHHLTSYGTRGTFEGARWQRKPPDTATLSSGVPCGIGVFRVEPFALPHDAREPIGMVIEAPGGERVGLVADLGTRSQLAWARLRDLDVLLLETNHDLTMLREGPYPWPLKQRVAGSHGHLSNAQAADGIPELLCDRLRHVVLYHLSRTNNLPALAETEVGEILAREGSPAEIVVTKQFEPTPWIDVPVPTSGTGPDATNIGRSTR